MLIFNKKTMHLSYLLVTSRRDPRPTPISPVYFEILLILMLRHMFKGMKLVANLIYLIAHLADKVAVFSRLLGNPVEINR